MGRRGPRPVATDVLRRRGSWRASINRNEPKPVAKAPKCPEWLDEDARRLWNELVPQLMAMGTLSEADRQPLARYCQTWSRWRKNEQFIQKYGETYPLKDEQGRVKCFMPWPQASLAHKLSQILGRLEQEFGLTPSARTRIDLTKCHTLTPEDIADQELKARFFSARPTPPRHS